MPSRAVLFDFDGTLADTAADLAAAVNRMRTEQGHEPLPLEKLRPFASAGARGLVHAAFGVKPGDAEYESMREAFLGFYAERVCHHTRLFPGVADLIRELQARKIGWGIVTNKSTRFTEQIVVALQLEPDCVVCGDTTPHLKPHPASLLHAAKELALEPAACVYLGDDLRDIQAARSAGMHPVAVEWGYGAEVRSWQADAVIRKPPDLVAYLDRAD